MLAIITLMGFTASVVHAGDKDSIKDANTETANATADANTANSAADAAAKNINLTSKNAEDKLDDAAKTQDDLPANATPQQQQDAQKGVDDATAHADDVRETMGNTDKVDAYRKALKARRDARKRLKLAVANLQRLIQFNNQHTGVDMTEYNHTVRDAKKAEKNADSRVAMVVMPNDSQVYVAVQSHHEESETHSHVARHQDRESVRENDKQVVSLIISLRPHCSCDR